MATTPATPTTPITSKRRASASNLAAPAKPLKLAEKRQHLITFADHVMNSPDQALAHFKEHPWIAGELIPVERNAKWNQVFDGGWAFHLACAFRRDALVDLMAPHGAPIHAVDAGGRNAISIALYKSRGADPTPTIKALLRHGCRVDNLDNDGAGVLYQPMEYPTSLLRLLIEAGAPVNCYNNAGSHHIVPFIKAVRDNPGRKANIMLLLESGINIEACQGFSRGEDNALKCALSFGHFEIADRLVALGADVRRRNNVGETLLHTSGSSDVTQWLLDRAPELLNQDNRDGRTPLLALAYRIKANNTGERYLKLFVHLVEAGADINQPQRRGDAGAPTARTVLAKHYCDEVQAMLNSLKARDVARAAMASLDVPTTMDR